MSTYQVSILVDTEPKRVQPSVCLQIVALNDGNILLPDQTPKMNHKVTIGYISSSSSGSPVP